MKTIREFLKRLGNLVHGERTDRDIEKELRFHLRMEEEAGLRRGLTRPEAERQARLRAGDVTGAMEKLRDQRSLPWLEGVLSEMRQAAVSLGRRRGFTATVIIALMLAVAVNTLIFSLLNGVILRPLPYPHPEQLVRVFESSKRNPKWPLSIGNFLEVQRNNRTFESMALYTGEDLQLMHDERAERLRAVKVTEGFFPTLGIRPMLGRNFTAADTRGTQRVVILSNRLWRTHFHSDPEIAGKSIRLNRETWTVIGVLPPEFQHIGGSFRSPLQGDTVAIWWPLPVDLNEQGLRQWHFCNVIARTKPGVSLPQAQQDLDRMAADLRTRFPKNDAQLSLVGAGLASEVVGRSSQIIWLLAAAGVLVLIVACANVAGLCIARGLARRKEVAVRQALGAPAWRLVRVVLCENFLLGVAGGAAGLGLAAALFPAWHALLPADFPRVHEVNLTLSAALFAVGCALATSLIAGLAPALYQLKSDPGSQLGSESRGSSIGREAGRLRTVLVASEVALAAILCSSATLLLHSSLRLSERSQGFARQGSLTFSLTLPASAYPKADSVNNLYDALLTGWRSLPGVTAGLASDVPWTGYDENSGFGVPGRQEESQEPQGRYHMASPGYFQAMGIPLRKGRYFEERDRLKSTNVVIVNETLARRYLAGENPIGQSLNIWGENRQVVGVVADVYDRPADPAAEPAFWFPLAQQPLRQVFAVLRTAGDPRALESTAARKVHDSDAEMALGEIRSMSDIAGDALGERNLANWLFEVFAGMALVLAIFGIYGLLSYIVEQRQREFGIRIALGATRGGIVWLVLKNGLMQAGAGGLTGILIAPLAARSLAGLLYGVTPFDPAPLLIVPALILALSVSASLIPAAAAGRAEPGATLRAD